MTATLTAGANTVLPGGPWSIAVPGPYDLAAVVLGADGRVCRDADFVFFNQPTTPGLTLRAGALEVDVRGLRPGAERVVVLASPADAGTFGRHAPPVLTVSAGGTPLARFTATGLTTETALQMAEVYRRDGQWKLRALGAGYADGLAGLARDFGVEVDDEPAHQPAEVTELAEVLALTNAARVEHGLVPLTAEPRLAEAARRHNDDMVARGFFAHESPEGGTVADRVRATGYGYRLVAENIAAGQRTPAEVVQGWLDSPGHRRNILTAEARHLGVALAQGGTYGTMWTQVFGALL